MRLQGRAEADSLLRAHGLALRERDEAAALFESAVSSLRESEQVPSLRCGPAAFIATVGMRAARALSAGAAGPACGGGGRECGA